MVRNFCVNIIST